MSYPTTKYSFMSDTEILSYVGNIAHLSPIIEELAYRLERMQGVEGIESMLDQLQDKINLECPVCQAKVTAICDTETNNFNLVI